MPRVYTYILKSDTGFAPNPFGGVCTLACCKPTIRRTAARHDWVVGLSSKAQGNKIIYAMEVDREPLGFADYHNSPEYKLKIPDITSKNLIKHLGDNIYRPLPDGGFKQLPSRHSNPDGSQDKFHKERDLRGKKVLISSNFYYFGCSAVELPEKFKGVIVGRSYRVNYHPPDLGKSLIKWLTNEFEPGMHGNPHKAPFISASMDSARHDFNSRVFPLC